MYVKNSVCLLLIALLFFSCENSEENNQEYLTRISELEAKQVELQNEVQEKDSAMMTFMKSIAEIERNLKEIRAREMNIELAQQEEGGFLGVLGRTEAVRDDFNHEKFTRIDIREKVIFPVEGKDVEVVTLHPAGSYTIEKEEDKEQVNLVVSDPEKFWESSKYLVMMVK